MEALQGWLFQARKFDGEKYLPRAQKTSFPVWAASPLAFSTYRISLPISGVAWVASLGEKGCSQKEGGDKKGMARMSAEPSG